MTRPTPGSSEDRTRARRLVAWGRARPGPRRLSLRARLLLITSALLTAGLVLSGSIVIGLLRANLVDRLDRQLQTLGGLVAVLPPGFGRDLPGRAGPGLLGGQAGTANLDLITDVYLAALTPAGVVQEEADVPARSGPGGPALPRLDAAEVVRRARQAFEVPDRAGPGRWRVIAMPRSAFPLIPGAPAPERGSGVVVAVSLDGVSSIVARLRTAILLSGAALLAVLTLTGLFAIRAGLRPLRRIEETAAAIASGYLARRVPDPGSSTEIGRLAASLNGMLTQIEQAFAARAESEARLRRFVADVGHELRTPLFGIRGFTELHRMGGLTDVDQAMSRIETESARLARLVEDLLLLARLDEGGDALPLDLAPMDLRTLAADARLDLKALAPDRPVTLTGPDGGPPAPAPVLGDESRLRQVVTNLVGNVVAHTPAGTPVRIGVGTRGATAVLSVTDHGPGLTPTQAARVFDRFYRTDPSRSRPTATGAGLGLSIASSLTTAHGGHLTLHTAPGHGATFTMTLPVAP
ncbi:sensor histidine kinase [Sphaerisporangium aureirubrum]|uniref:histidine kinase n=1 Tax=Sphaerisporangium aureirubrum TaxID=1544736 RepID=A0ABW1NIY8_9ACTN